MGRDPAAPRQGEAALSSAPGALAGEEDRLLACVHCGFCLPACPTYVRLGEEADSPRGRLYLMRAVAEGRLDPASQAFQTHIDRCLGCRACEPVCPSGVEYGALLERARSEAAAARRPGFLTRRLLGVFSHDRVSRFFLATSRALRATGLPALLARLLPPAGPLRRLKLAAGMLAASTRPTRMLRKAGTGRRSPPVPAPDARPQAPGPAAPAGGHAPEERRSGDPDDAPVPPAGSDPGRHPAMPPGALDRTPTTAAARGHAVPGRGAVHLLTGCVQEGLFAGVNRATERVLEVNGYRVVAPEGQGCCGALHAHGGDLEGARALARKNVEAFEAVGDGPVVVNAAGCGAIMKEYGELLADDPDYAERARAVAGRVRDVSELLAQVGPVAGAAVPLRVAYDPPCHLLHAQRVADPPRTVLAAVPGVELLPLEDASECCGGAGIYGLTHPGLGGRIGADKVRAVQASGAEAVATGNPGCIMQIGGGLRGVGAGIAALHPVEVLDESYRRAGLYADR